MAVPNVKQLKEVRPEDVERVENLKRDWRNDPCWDIYDTEGFEMYREILATYQALMEIEWQLQREAKLQAASEAMGIPGNLVLAQYLVNLEEKVKRLEDVNSELRDAVSGLQSREGRR